MRRVRGAWLFDEAFRRGELSYSKLRAMTRVATPATEAQLLDLARCSTAAQLERICRFYRQARSQVGEDPRTVEDDRRWVVMDSPRQRAGVCSATLAWCRCWRTPAARPSTSGERLGPYPRLSDGRSALAT